MKDLAAYLAIGFAFALFTGSADVASMLFTALVWPLVALLLWSFFAGVSIAVLHSAAIGRRLPQHFYAWGVDLGPVSDLWPAAFAIVALLLVLPVTLLLRRLVAKHAGPRAG